MQLQVKYDGVFQARFIIWRCFGVLATKKKGPDRLGRSIMDLLAALCTAGFLAKARLKIAMLLP
jgi:hypothetical protein